MERRVTESQQKDFCELHPRLTGNTRWHEIIFNNTVQSNTHAKEAVKEFPMGLPTSSQELPCVPKQFGHLRMDLSLKTASLVSLSSGKIKFSFATPHATLGIRILALKLAFVFLSMLNFCKLKERWKDLTLEFKDVHKIYSQPPKLWYLTFFLHGPYQWNESLPEWLILSAIWARTIPSVMGIFRCTTTRKPPPDVSILNSLRLPTKTRTWMWASQTVSHTKFQGDMQPKFRHKLRQHTHLDPSEPKPTFQK